MVRVAFMKVHKLSGEKTLAYVYHNISVIIANININCMEKVGKLRA